MPKQDLTNTPTALANIAADTAYTVQFRSAYPVYVQAATTAPTDNSEAFKVRGSGFSTVSRNSGQQVYVWQDENNDYGVVVYDTEA